uniref:Uncharacterized protein n=1 Tax=Candidatus Berkiella aquae TaxID=295108 RepID=A0A0Q9YXL5_9GAMM
MLKNASLGVKWVLTAIICFSTLTLLADPSDRVARLSRIEGNMSFLPAGGEDWLDATLNRPLVAGDSLWNDANTFSQLQLGEANLYIGSNTNINVLNLNNDVAQFQLTEGSLILKVNGIKHNQIYEIDTPNLAFTVQKLGYYRVDVDKDGNATIVQINQGQGHVYGDSHSYIINNGQAYRFTGTNLDYDPNFTTLAEDDFDRWSNQRQVAKQTRQSHTVSQEIIGAEDLDSYGNWVTIEEYGPVWSPSDIDSDWAPYRHGHWAWIEPWGWSWIGLEPWGFAPYHYGRWVYADKWYWVPYSGADVVYAPALVAFIGDGSFGAEIGWFPLGPGDIYSPAYAVSFSYFKQINSGDKFINKKLLKQAYGNPHMHFNYQNFKINNGITAVKKDAFLSPNIKQARVPLNAAQLNKATISQSMNIKPVTDTKDLKTSRFKPSEQVLKRGALTKSQVPQNRQTFQARGLGTEKVQKNVEPKASASFSTLQPVKPSKPREIAKGSVNTKPERTLQKPREPGVPTDKQPPNLRKHYQIPDKELLQAPKHELQQPKRELQQAPQRELRQRPEREIEQAPQRELRQRPEREIQQAPQRELRQRPEREIQQAPQRELRQRPEREIQQAPQRELHQAPQREIQQAPQRELRQAPQLQQMPQQIQRQVPQQPMPKAAVPDDKGKH